MEEKRVDLDVERQKKIILEVVNRLSKIHGDMYYNSTSDIAFLVKEFIKNDASISSTDRLLLADLSTRDIALRLSIR